MTTYGLHGEFTPLYSERDQNFRVTSERDGRFVLKVYNRAEAPGVVDFQTQALLHIERQDPTLDRTPCPTNARWGTNDANPRSKR